ncbi:hypothetical protein BX257_1316 [Streptomyces sp. 3212.3]|nr:hypothetical protein BX257_1316 [Streptomyces sp. 3212.3]
MTAESGSGQSCEPGDGELSAMAPVRLRRLNRLLVQSLREDLANLYAESRATTPGDPRRRHSRQNLLNRLTAGMRRPECAMATAETDSLMGCTFGFSVRGDGSWWLGFDGILPRSVGHLTVSDSVFAFADVMIWPHPRDRELARCVQERLLTDHQTSLEVTLVDRTDCQALAALCSWGWLDIGELRRPLAATTFRTLVLPLEGLVTMPADGGLRGN